jgi:nucleoside-diphosphate-sugar epimerase
MTLLLTGASGFVGQNILKTMQQCGLKVRPVYRSINSAKGQSHSVLVPDWDSSTCWSQALQGIDVVIHSAARAHIVREVSFDPLTEYRRVNVQGTLNLARQAAQKGSRRFVFLSSIKVNGEETQSGQSFTSDDIPLPLDPYGVSKLEAEYGLREIESKTGMEVVVIRPTLVYGPNVRANFLRILKIVDRGIPLPFGSVKNKRSMVSIDNLVDLVSICISHPMAAGQTFIASDGHDLSTPELICQLALLMGRQAHLISVPPRLLRLLGTLIGRRNDVERLLGTLQVDIGHTRNTLDWTPPVNVQVGLSKTVDWYLSATCSVNRSLN